MLFFVFAFDKKNVYFCRIILHQNKLFLYEKQITIFFPLL